MYHSERGVNSALTPLSSKEVNLHITLSNRSRNNALFFIVKQGFVELRWLLTSSTLHRLQTATRIISRSKGGNFAASNWITRKVSAQRINTFFFFSFFQFSYSFSRSRYFSALTAQRQWKPDRSLVPDWRRQKILMEFLSYAAQLYQNSQAVQPISFDIERNV